MSVTERRPYPARMPAAERREQLLDVTGEIAAREGLHAVTIDAVAREAGITRPVVYNQFGGLQGLLSALIERGEQRALAAVAAAIPDFPSERRPDELVVDGMRRFLEAVREDPVTWRLVLMPSDGAPVELREAVERGRATALDRLKPLIAWGIGELGGPKQLDAELLARGLQTLVEDAARLVLVDPERYSPERQAEHAGILIGWIARAG
jgi:AcrR family transcriptional regulator